MQKLRTKLIERLQVTNLDEKPYRNAKFDPNNREGKHFLQVAKENPGTLLISGGVLAEAVEKSFKDFVEYLMEEES